MSELRSKGSGLGVGVLMLCQLMWLKHLDSASRYESNVSWNWMVKIISLIHFKLPADVRQNVLIDIWAWDHQVVGILTALLSILHHLCRWRGKHHHCTVTWYIVARRVGNVLQFDHFCVVLRGEVRASHGNTNHSQRGRPCVRRRTRRQLGTRRQRPGWQAPPTTTKDHSDSTAWLHTQSWAVSGAYGGICAVSAPPTINSRTRSQRLGWSCERRRLRALQHPAEAND